MIAPEKVAELAADYRSFPPKQRTGFAFVCAAEALADAGLDMADLIAKQAAEIGAYRRGAAHSAGVFADLKADFDMQATEIERLKGDLAELEEQWSNLQDLLGAYDAKCQKHGIEVIKWEQNT
jgi:chromosome segregation ATPase